MYSNIGKIKSIRKKQIGPKVRLLVVSMLLLCMQTGCGFDGWLSLLQKNSTKSLAVSPKSLESQKATGDDLSSLEDEVEDEGIHLPPLSDHAPLVKDVNRGVLEQVVASNPEKRREQDVDDGYSSSTEDSDTDDSYSNAGGGELPDGSGFIEDSYLNAGYGEVPSSKKGLLEGNAPYHCDGSGCNQDNDNDDYWYEDAFDQDSNHDSYEWDDLDIYFQYDERDDERDVDMEEIVKDCNQFRHSISSDNMSKQPENKDGDLGDSNTCSNDSQEDNQDDGQEEDDGDYAASANYCNNSETIKEPYTLTFFDASCSNEGQEE